MKRILPFAISCLLVTMACQKIIEIDLPQHGQKPVVNCLFTNSEPFKVHLSLTKTADAMSYPLINDAEVSIFSDGHLLAVLPSKGEGTYFDSNVYPEENHSYSLQTSIPGYDQIIVEDFLPAFGIRVIDNDFKKNAGTDDAGFNYSELKVKMEDIDPQSNFYGIAVLCEQNNGEFYPIEITSNDPKIRGEMIVEDYPKILVFRDDLFNGSGTLISVKFSDDSATRFRLYTFSEAAFEYIKTLTIHNYTKDYDFWEVYEPIAVYSNIENGHGIFAGYSSRDYEIKMGTAEINIP